jgi:tRNA (mo5U34)-methyltransferase
MNQTSADEYFRLANEFFGKALELGYADLEKYFWYHTIDLGNDLITPGCYDYRPSLPAFGFPNEMQGISALDVGSATGFFAFEFEKRGASVTSVEIPSLLDWDCFPGETSQQFVEKTQRELAKVGWKPGQESLDHLFANSTPEELYRYSLDGPFEFCHKQLGSQVVRRYARIYDLSEPALGNTKFDLVFAGDVLWHTINPLQALAAMAAVCSGTLIIAQDLQDHISPHPIMHYIGGDKAGEDSAAWWVPNGRCFEQVLKKLGFKDVAVVGKHSGFMRPAGISYERSIIHAKRE